MNFAQAISTCLNKYVDFSGRARRSEYWFFYLFTTIVTGAANFIFGAGSWAASIISLLLFLPGLSVAFRRLHDVGAVDVLSELRVDRREAVQRVGPACILRTRME